MANRALDGPERFYLALVAYRIAIVITRRVALILRIRDLNSFELTSGSLAARPSSDSRTPLRSPLISPSKTP